MEFLAYRNINHGDLVTRNVLLTEHLTTKLYGEFSGCPVQKDQSQGLIPSMKWEMVSCGDFGSLKGYSNKNLSLV